SMRWERSPSISLLANLSLKNINQPDDAQAEPAPLTQSRAVPPPTSKSSSPSLPSGKKRKASLTSDEANADPSVPEDQWLKKFLEHLAVDRGASSYTQRNYRQALIEFQRWHFEERKRSPAWPELTRDDFRSYLRFLGRHNLGRAAIQL